MPAEHQQTKSASRSVTSTSRSLLVRLRENDSDAWDRLVELYTPLVYFWCRRTNLPQQDIADVVQEVFKAVAANIDRFRKERPEDTFRGWLRTITRSKVSDHGRRQQHQPKAAGGTEAMQRISDTPDPVIDDDVEEEQVCNSVFMQALDQIRVHFQDQTWQAFWKVVVDGKSPKEAGEDLSMTAGAVRVAKSRVLQRLRQEMGELLD